MKHIPNTHINCQIPKNEYTPHMTGTGNAMKQMGFTWAKFVYQHILREVMLNLRWTPIPTRPQLALPALNVPESVQIIRLMDTAVGPTFYFWYYSSSSVCLVKPPAQYQLTIVWCLCATEALYTSKSEVAKNSSQSIAQNWTKSGKYFHTDAH